VSRFPDLPPSLPRRGNAISKALARGLRVRFLGKHTLFKPPLGWLMRWLGGTPVVRETPQGAVADAAEMIAREQRVLLGIAPEGTRSRGKPWRSGFYNIALAAKVPILPAAFDFGRKSLTLFPLFEPSGDFDADLAKLQALYADVTGCNP
jgi:1-acyl-sn-glycerol-3-phosphate acyltransferase